jgi:type I restriction enzyme S subunit
LKIGSGSTPTGGQHTYLKEGIPFLRSQNIWNDGLKLNDVAFISNFTHSKMKNSTVQSKDILLNITGGSLGRCTLLPDNFQEANINQHVSIVRVINPEIRHFLHICMLSPYIQNMIWSRQVGMAREGLSKKVLELFEIPLPPLEEQRRIVKKVNSLIKLCDDLEQQLTKKEDISKKLASTTISYITGIEIKEKEKMKVPKNELVSILKIKNKPNQKDEAPLAKILLEYKGELSSKLLWTYSELDIENFYMQLKIELANDWIEQPQVAKMIDVEEK